MIKKLDCTDDEKILYEYFKAISGDIPYYFPVDFDLWRKSMFCDTTDDSKSLFKELETHLFYENNILKGFIQYGITSFIFGENGPDYNNGYAIIRNIHYFKDSENPGELIETALEYFRAKNINKINAFFHFFGMSCYARHGKLHESQFYIENLLRNYSFVKEHENVYFSKNLDSHDVCDDFEMNCEVNFEANKMSVKFLLNDEYAGHCELGVLHSGICYLFYIEVFEKYRGQGIGTRCVNKLFYILKHRHIKKIDLDTIDKNFPAQGLYKKMGFVNMGITRSYYNKPD